MNDDAVFRALADKSRRALLDHLFRRNGQSLAELTAAMPMTRQAVAKHVAILEAAHLISSHRRGREKLHYLNPIPIGEIVRRWVGKFEDARIEGLVDFKHDMETAPQTQLEKRRA